MRFYKLDQGSEEWFEWRKTGIGASESPIILGLSPFATPLQLYNLKKGITNPEGNDFATKKGHLMEPTARMFYETQTGIKTEPSTVAHDELSWMKASLDGWSEKHKILVEIKCPGKKDWSLAEKGEIPEYYLYQVQHQMFVTGTNKAHYYAFNGEYGRLIVVYADKEIQKQIVHAAGVFMERLRLEDPPPLSDRDVKVIDDSELVEKVALHRKIQSQIKMDTETLKALEKDIAEKCDHSKCLIDDMRVIKYSRKGSIDWKTIKSKPEFEKFDFEKYRKQPIEITQFRDGKKEETHAS